MAPDHRTNASGAITVVSLADAAVIAQAGVVATSLAAHATADRPVRHVIFTDAPDSPALERLAAFRHGAVMVELRRIQNSWDRFGGVLGIPPMTYLRLSLPDLLPDLDRVIYLDTDVTAHDGLATLFDSALGGRAIGAVPDLPMTLARDWTIQAKAFRGKLSEYFAQVLGLDPEVYLPLYVNSGVMLMDLARLRQLDFTARATRFVEAKNDVLFLGDQDVINALLLASEIAPLDLRWNVMTSSYSTRFRRHAGAERFAMFTRQRLDPGIFHFTGGEKPWLPRRRRRIPWAWWSYARHAPEAESIVAHFRAGARPWPFDRVPLPDAIRDRAFAPVARHLDAIGLPARI